MLSALHPSKSLVAGELRPDPSPAGLLRPDPSLEGSVHEDSSIRGRKPCLQIGDYVLKRTLSCAHQVFDLVALQGTSTSRCSTTSAEPELLRVGFGNEQNAGYACAVTFNVGLLSVLNAIRRLQREPAFPRSFAASRPSVSTRGVRGQTKEAPYPILEE